MPPSSPSRSPGSRAHEPRRQHPRHRRARRPCRRRPRRCRLPAPPTRREWPAYDPRARLTAAQTKWVDSTLASLSLRERVGQMVMVWVLGDYTSYGDSTLRRGAAVDRAATTSAASAMSLGTPIEVAAKINDHAAPRRACRSWCRRTSSRGSAASRAACSRTTCSTPAARRCFRAPWPSPRPAATRTRTTSRSVIARGGARRRHPRSTSRRSSTSTTIRRIP